MQLTTGDEVIKFWKVKVGGSKIIFKLYVIEETCSWLQIFRLSNPGGSQTYISLITYSFLMILLSSSNFSRGT